MDNYGQKDKQDCSGFSCFQRFGHSDPNNREHEEITGKMERNPAHPRYIETVWGVGCRFRG